MVQLPEKLLDENSLPFPIASNISVGEYNSFIENQEISGYKFEYKKGTVYIVDMASPEHEAVVEIIGNYFRALCFTTDATGAVPVLDALNLINAPIQVVGQSLHNAPDGTCKAPDLAIYPHHNFVPAPPIAGPSSDIRGNPYARVMLEVTVSQSSSELKDRCRIWKQQPYVRTILGIKLYDVSNTRNTAGQRNRAMKAMLWQRGVARQKWHFGTINKDGSATGTTGCNTANDPKYIINIPARDIFYDQPITATGYTTLPTPSAALMGANVAIDLYYVQQFVFS